MRMVLVTISFAAAKELPGAQACIGSKEHHEEACNCVKPEIADLLRRSLDGIGDHRAHFAELRAKDGCC